MRRQAGSRMILQLLAWMVIAPAPAAESIPAVGCPSDGQAGPIESPPDGSQAVNLDSQTAPKVAYYHAAEGPGVLAPRGWYCRMWYGSSGTELIVTPEPIRPPFFPIPRIAGPGVSLVSLDSDSSGRFTVAAYVGQLFPTQARKFVAQVKQEIDDLELAGASNPPSGSFDVRRPLSPTAIEFTTPAARDGLGTVGAFAKSVQPVHGVVVLRDPEGELSLSVVRVRLPEGMGILEQAIVHAAEEIPVSPR